MCLAILERCYSSDLLHAGNLVNRSQVTVVAPFAYGVGTGLGSRIWVSGTEIKLRFVRWRPFHRL